jgi:hypothetical protein
VTKALPATCTGPIHLVPVGRIYADTEAEMIDERLLKMLGKFFVRAIYEPQ